MDEAGLTRRQERAAERMLEDEGLTGGLSDEPARALIAWAQQAALGAAAPPERTDEQVAALLQAIRRAARQAAATSPGDPLLLAAAADRALAELAPELRGGAGDTMFPSTDAGRRATEDPGVRTQNLEPITDPAAVPSFDRAGGRAPLAARRVALTTYCVPS